MSGNFIFLMRPSGAPINAELRHRFDNACARNHVPALAWQCDANWGAGLGTDVGGAGTGPNLTLAPLRVVVGNARLDNRHELLSRMATPERRTGSSDLHVIASAITSRGIDCVSEILGDFGFVAWDTVRRKLIAARDPFGVNGLYFAEAHDLVAVASRPALLAVQEDYDREYLRDYLIGEFPSLDRTPYDGVSALVPGTVWAWSKGSGTTTQFWSPHDFPMHHEIQPGQAIEEFRSLFTRAVASCLGREKNVWAELSGGLDSSSVVSMAQSLASSGGEPRGLCGTVTIVDSLGAGDEREYVAEVLARHPVPNVEITDYGMWQGNGAAPPMADRPHPGYPFFARDLDLLGTVRAGGGRILLSGQGADHYLTGSLHYAADLISSMQIKHAIEEVRRWAGTLRTSLWRLGFEYALAPHLPKGVRRRMLDESRIPAWVCPDGPRRRDMAQRVSELRQIQKSNGSYYAGRIAYLVERMPWVADRPIHTSFVEMRYPFLYRPLIEFSLRLPPQIRSQPHARKWVLRQAMSRCVPTKVLRRHGKGGITARVTWSLEHERARLAQLLRNPILGQLDLADVKGLRRSVEDAQNGRRTIHVSTFSALTLETWLQVRSGQWVNQVPVQEPGEQMCSQLPVTI